MNRFFNNAGPIIPADHYHIPPLERVDWEEIQQYLREKRYFVLHAPRQTGKTSTLLAMMHALNQADEYTALYANIEGAQAARHDLSISIPGICQAIARSAQWYLKDEVLFQWLDQQGQKCALSDMLTQLLQHWSMHNPKPIVLMLDEVDALVGDTLISLLRQLRAGYGQRPQGFPQSVILCGVRDVRDYRIHSKDQEVITGGSAFNIKAKSLRLGNFTAEEVKALFLQHTQATGQVFDEAIFPELWEDTCGQPWLVNALGYELTSEDKSARDRSVRLTLERYRQARERLIQSRATHLDQLTDKLREERVYPIIAALLSGEQTDQRFRDDDLEYLEDLGLIVRKPEVRISNRIYREVIPREITSPLQDMIHQPDQSWYLLPDRRLDLPKLLSAFQQFFREHSQAWLQQFEYQEAGPHLLLQAFLQRVINGGGRVHREYGLGRTRTDLLVEWPLDLNQGYTGPVQRIVIELKILRKGLEKTLSEGLEQVWGYADGANAEEAHLMIFNRDEQVSWADKIWRRQETWRGRAIQVWGA